MRIQPIDNAQAFKALDYRDVSTADREQFVKKSFSELSELGKKYDITLLSAYCDIPGYSSIDIYVRPLKKGLSFIKRICRPVVSGSFIKREINPIKTKVDFINAINHAITNLQKKVNLHK